MLFLAKEKGFRHSPEYKDFGVDVERKFVWVAMEELEAKIADLHWDDAKRLIHTLKGVSGNIGAKRLHDASVKLEAEVKLENTIKIKGVLESLSDNLNMVLEGIHTVIESQPSKQRQTPDKETGIIEALKTWTEELSNALSKRKPKPAKAIIAQINTYLWSDAFNLEIQELSRYVGKYKFKEALRVLDVLKTKLD